MSAFPARRSFLLFLLCGSIFISGGLFAGEEKPVDRALTIKEYLEAALPPQAGRKVDFNEITGLLTVTDTPSNQIIVEKLVSEFDKCPRQILIEAKFVEVKFTNLDELGIEWYWRRLGGTPVGSSNSSDATSNSYGIHWDASSASTFPLTDFGLDLFISKTKRDGNFLRAYLHALEQEKKANLLASPKVNTISGQPANIQVTRTIPYLTNIDFENVGTAENPIWQYDYEISERATGIVLEVIPYLGDDGDIITLDIRPEVSNRTSGVNPFVFTTDSGQAPSLPTDMDWPVIETRATQASVVIASGETIVMGGLIKDDDTTRNKKIPFLGDIPFVGKLFQYEYVSREKTNLLIFLTATIVDPEGNPEDFEASEARVQ